MIWKRNRICRHLEKSIWRLKIFCPTVFFEYLHNLSKKIVMSAYCMEDLRTFAPLFWKSAWLHSKYNKIINLLLPNCLTTKIEIKMWTFWETFAYSTTDWQNRFLCYNLLQSALIQRKSSQWIVFYGAFLILSIWRSKYEGHYKQNLQTLRFG